MGPRALPRQYLKENASHFPTFAYLFNFPEGDGYPLP